MNILVLGNGGREHAIAWKVSKSSLVENLYVVPSNPAVAKFAECIDVDITDFDALDKIVKSKNIDLIIPGPEAPLVAGVTDYFKEKGVMVFGPNKKAAQLEGSKCFSKDILKKYNIPTAKFENFTDKDAALKKADEFGYPTVIKADGLAGGKGAVIVYSHDAAEKVLNEIMLDKVFGDAGNRVVIEEFLKGYEVSLHLVLSGSNYKLLPFSQDHKQIFDGDKGPNTGGMGAYAPCPLVNFEVLAKIEANVIKPLLKGFKKEGINYTGILYIGLMVDNDVPNVLEFNVRLGDPETQVLLPLIQTDFLEAIVAACKGDLSEVKFKLKDEFAVGITLASKGYPSSSQKDIEIFGLENFKDVSEDDILIFHAGTKEENGKILTNGGRVLTFVAFDKILEFAIKKAYTNIGKINFSGMQYRKDIAQRSELKIKN